jgi:hypothetical protein
MVLKFNNASDNAIAQWHHATSTMATTEITNHESTGGTTTVNKTSTWYPTYFDNQNYNTGLTRSPDTFPGSKSFLESVNAEFAFYSPQGRPTRIHVQLVQLHKDVSHGKNMDLATAFGQSIAKPWGYSSIEKGD